MRNKLAALKHKALHLARKPNARKAFWLTALMYLSPLIGLVLDNLLARAFGVGTALDIFRLITSFMFLGAGLVAGTLLKYAIIPELARAKAAGNMASGLRFVIAITGLVFALMLPLILCGVLAPGWLLNLLGPGLPRVPEAHALVQVAALGFALMIISSAGGALLQFYHTFWAQPAGQVALNSALMLLVLASAHHATTLGAQLHLLALGLAIGVAGWLCIFAVLLYQLWRSHLRGQTPAASYTTWRHTLMCAAMALAPQILIMASEILKPLLINRQLSFFGEGSITLYSYALKLMMLGQLPAMAILSIMFPTLAMAHATQTAQNDNFKKHSLIIGGLGVAIGGTLWLLAPWVTYVLFGLANLSVTEQLQLNVLVKILAFSMPSGMLMLFYSQVLYARNQVKRVVIYNFVLVMLTVMAVTLPTGKSLEPFLITIVAANWLATCLLAYYCHTSPKKG